ncbi:uncharacterized protein LOC141643591 [Silene latifolia]|uniref:uncharacterized protein LOC141643591 n=1 Tax=Silene latifolia TaxID=37657 RepID=UPI003D7806DC
MGTGTSKLSTLGAAATAATVASLSTPSNHAYADVPSWFPTFSKSRSPSPPPSSSDNSSSPDNDANSADESTGRSPGFDPDHLERGAKALREINNSPYNKQVFEVMRNQEKTRLQELEVDKIKMEIHHIQKAIERQQGMAEEQRQLYQQQAQVKAQVMRQEDELARKRMQHDHETQRRNNAELVRMQEESSWRQEKARRATEEQIQAQQRQTEKERAQIEQETIRVKAMAEAEARAHEAKLTEDQNRRMLIDRLSGEKEKWLAAINTTFGHVEGGLRDLLTDRSKLFMTVGGVTALAAGVYTTREGARVSWGYINRILGQPSLIRESSMSKFPSLALPSRGQKNLLRFSTSAGATVDSTIKSGFDNVVLHTSLQRRIEQLARATANTKVHQAPFRNMLFYGPPGTGKTLVAREIARKSGLDYAMMTGGDVAPLGPQAVTKIHEIFDWAKKSKKGLLLFIDEADAFLCERNSTYMSEAQRSALNALLFRTGDQSRDIVLVLATNRPGDLDSAVTDRIDEVIEFPLPGEEERYKLIKLYVNKYLSGQNGNGDKGPVFKIRKKPQSITITDLSDDVIREAAKKTDGFSGREIAKLVASIQAAVYGRPDCSLDNQLFAEIVDYKVSEHHQRLKLATEGGQSS